MDKLQLVCLLMLNMKLLTLNALNPFDGVLWVLKDAIHNFLTFSFHRHQLIVVYSFLPCPNYNVTNFIVK